MKLIVSEAILEKFGNATIGALHFKISSIGVSDLSTVITEAKNNSVKCFLAEFSDVNFAEIPQVKLWSSIFEKMNVKKGRESSIVFLSNHVLERKDLFSISPFVDLYNAISLKYGIPMGGYNIANFFGDIELRVARKGEEFFGIGSKQVEKTSANEVVYSDGQGVFCRCWNDKDCDRTKIVDGITDILYVFDGIDQKAPIECAIEEIVKTLSISDFTSGIAEKTTPCIEI